MSKRVRRIRKPEGVTQEGSDGNILTQSQSRVDTSTTLPVLHSFASESTNEQLLQTYYRKTLTYLLEAVGMDATQIEHVKSSIDQTLTASQHFNLHQAVALSKTARLKIVSGNANANSLTH